MTKRNLLFSVIISFLAGIAWSPAAARAEGPPPIQKPIEVKGQSRNFSMMVPKNKKTQVRFIKMRRDYRKEIPTTLY